jgi:hypothetical protein
MNPQDSFFGRVAKPGGWSEETYNRASKKLATWDVDFKWTIAQHEAGAKFAAQTCKKRGLKEKPLHGICPEGPPDGKSVYGGDDSKFSSWQSPPSEQQKGVR